MASGVALQRTTSMSDFWIKRSWATEPLLTRAPYPENMEAREYELAGAEYAVNREHSLIGDEPGTGKSMQAVLVDNLIESGRTLVVCPASLRLNWEREIWAWSTIPNVTT